MKKYKIIDRGKGWTLRYKVVQRHWALFIPFWDSGAERLCPNYSFKTKEEALMAIAKTVTKED